MTIDAQPVMISGHEVVLDRRDALRDTGRHFKLSRLALMALLRRYLDDHISAESIVDVAEALEMNERVNVDEPKDIGINDALFLLANPEINGELTKVKALSLVDALVRAQRWSFHS
jgi:hypothetical protein